MALIVHISLVVGSNMCANYAKAGTDGPIVTRPQVEVSENKETLNIYSLGNSPVKVSILKNYIKHYPHKEIANEIIVGFTYGFSLKYSGSRLPRDSSNLKSAEQLPELLKVKLSKEINLGRIAGPFKIPPFPTLQVSPLGLVPKKDGDYRLIHHLSYPENNSINDFIDKEFCSVQYSSVDEAAALISKHKKLARLSQCDVKSAFRILPISPADFDLLGIKFQEQYYFDKMLPMGASISCALWEKFATVLHWITQQESGNENILHYLDDFLFVESVDTFSVGETLHVFEKICHEIGVPLAKDKTTKPCTVLTFLGI